MTSLLKNWLLMGRKLCFFSSMFQRSKFLVQQCEFCISNLLYFFPLNKQCYCLECADTHQITHPVMIIIAWLTQVKNASRGAPLWPILPSVIPITVENTTRPMMLVPCA